MSDRDPGLEAGFAGLRCAHQSERAPEVLRRRMLERPRSVRSPRTRRATLARAWLSRGGLLGAAAGVGACLSLGISLFVAHEAVDPSSSPGRAHVVPSAELARPIARRCGLPLGSLPWNPAEIGTGAKAAGFDVEVLETETDCGPLPRRFLVRAPAGGAASSPVLIVLHEAGETAEAAQHLTRRWSDDLADQEEAVLVYANGSQNLLSRVSGPMNAGVWQTDEGVHPIVDDAEYLRDVVDRLREKRHLARGEVFLLGYGSGGVMALVAALRDPERYAGVAAFLPPRLPWKEDLGGGPGAVAHSSHLRSIFIELPGAPATAPSALAVQWAAALGTETGPIRPTHAPHFEQVDSSLSNGAALRIVRHSGERNPSLAPGAAEPLPGGTPRANPSFDDAPGAAWEFFHSSTR